MASETKQISATVSIDTVDEIQKIASKDKRSFSEMVAILLEEAIIQRKPISE